MLVCLVGYPGSQKIVNASKYLTDKYLSDFTKMYLNYEGPINGWADYVKRFFEMSTSKHVIFALDDYLLSAPLDTEKYQEAAEEFLDDDVVCVKLCQSTPEEHEEYPVTTQYTIWDREFLIWLLGEVRTPWEFEMRGSKLFKITNNKSIHCPCLEYFANSSLSARWEGVRLDGLNEEDINYLKTKFLI